MTVPTVALPRSLARPAGSAGLLQLSSERPRPGQLAPSTESKSKEQGGRRAEEPFMPVYAPARSSCLCRCQCPQPLPPTRWSSCSLCLLATGLCHPPPRRPGALLAELTLPSPRPAGPRCRPPPCPSSHPIPCSRLSWRNAKRPSSSSSAPAVPCEPEPPSSQARQGTRAPRCTQIPSSKPSLVALV